MSQRDMQHQAAVDGSASATDGCSPAGEAPPPATRLLDLPPALLDDIACRVMQLQARIQLPLTCRAFSQAHLLHVPALRIQLGRHCYDQLLTPQVVAALQARTSKLTLTLWQPGTEHSSDTETETETETDDSECYTELLAHALAKLDNCAAVEVCKLVSSGDYPHCHMRCSPGLAQHLLDSFPSLTALTLEGLRVSSDALASLLSYPPLARQLQQLHLTNTSFSPIPAITNIIVPEAVEQWAAPGAVGTPFQGLRLKELSLDFGQPGTPMLPSFQPLAQHLTQLHLMNHFRLGSDLGNIMEYLQPLAQLQVLTVTGCYKLNGLIEVLQELPQLHTLRLPSFTVEGHQQLDTLLAATQITSLQIDSVDFNEGSTDSSVEALDTSYADAPCSWQRLELTGGLKRSGIAYLPLHSLTQPLVLGRLDISVELISDPEVAAILHHLAEACKVPVQIMEMELEMQDPSREVITPALLQQQRKDLAQLGALLQPLRCCGMVQVTILHEVTAADVQALAPLCQDCTHFTLVCGSMEPSLEFWHQLVQLMPAVQEVFFAGVKGCVSAAMHESLQLMAQQPWARWLHVIIRGDIGGSDEPLYRQAGSWWKAGIVKVTMLHSRYYD